MDDSIETIFRAGFAAGFNSSNEVLNADFPFNDFAMHGTLELQEAGDQLEQAENQAWVEYSGEAEYDIRNE